MWEKAHDKEHIGEENYDHHLELNYLLQDLAEEAGSSVTGGQTVLNPWLTIGGVASTVCQPNEFIM